MKAIGVMCAGSLAIMVSTASGAIIVNERFVSGASNGAVMDAVVTTGSTGLSGSWAFSTPSAKYFTFAATGLTMAGYGGEGGATTFTGSNFAPSNIQRAMSSGLGYGTYYQSNLVRISTLGNNGATSGVEFGVAGSNGNSATVTLSPDEFGSFLGGSRVGGTTNLNSGSAFTAGTTYLMLNRIAFSAGSITLDRYILTPDQLTYFIANGGLDASLSQAITTGTATGQVLQRGTQTRATSATNLPYSILEGYANNALYVATYDELRISNTSFGELVPEPACLGLIGFVAAAITRRRRP